MSAKEAQQTLSNLDYLGYGSKQTAVIAALDILFEKKFVFGYNN